MPRVTLNLIGVAMTAPALARPVWEAEARPDFIIISADDLGDYDRVGRGARFFGPGPRRPQSAAWIKGGSQDR